MGILPPLLPSFSCKVVPERWDAHRVRRALPIRPTVPQNGTSESHITSANAMGRDSNPRQTIPSQRRRPLSSVKVASDEGGEEERREGERAGRRTDGGKGSLVLSCGSKDNKRAAALDGGRTGEVCRDDGEEKLERESSAGETEGRAADPAVLNKRGDFYPRNARGNERASEDEEPERGAHLSSASLSSLPVLRPLRISCGRRHYDRRQ